MESACVANDEFPERKEQKWVLLPYAEWVEKGEERMRDGRCKKYGETPEQKVAADISRDEINAMRARIQREAEDRRANRAQWAGGW